jgi:isopentenyl phosphate kinase
MQHKPIIVKLGGSIITEKDATKPVIRTRQVKRLAREIFHAYGGDTHASHPPLILLYGAGSFGHPLAHEYQLSGRALSHDTIVGITKTTHSMRKLGGALTDIFLKEGVPVVPLQTSAFVREQHGKLVITNYSLIEDILAHGGVPLLGGDVIIADHHHTAIVSADRLASEFVRHFHSRKLLFATDVSGVYKKFPARAHEHPIPTMGRKELSEVIALQSNKNSNRDVTGAMGGKLRALLSLRNCSIIIFNGLDRGALGRVLHGESEGTCITL